MISIFYFARIPSLFTYFEGIANNYSFFEELILFLFKKKHIVDGNWLY